MQIQRQPIRRQTQRYTLGEGPNPRSRLSSTVGGTLGGAVAGAGAGITASAVVVGGAAILSAVSGESVSLGEVGLGMLEAASIVAPMSAGVGAVVGGVTANLTDKDSTPLTASMIAGGVAGVGSLGFAVYGALQALNIAS